MKHNTKQKMEEGKIYCAKHDVPMEEVILDTYEYIEGLPLRNVLAYKCPKDGEIFFTEEQADRLEQTSRAMRIHAFAFKRKVTYSGKSLAVTIPEDLAAYLGLQKGKPVRILPLDKRGFIVEVKK